MDLGVIPQKEKGHDELRSHSKYPKFLAWLDLTCALGYLLFIMELSKKEVSLSVG